MTYSQQLRNLALQVHPDWPELHPLLEKGSIWAERLLCDSCPSGDAIDLANAIVAATQSGAAFDLANAVLLKEEVYLMCKDENKNRNTVGPND